MIAISTEGRVFIAQLTREIVARERKGAAMLSPGMTTWCDAFKNIIMGAHKLGSPTKAAKHFNAAQHCLIAAQKDSLCTLNSFSKRSRSAHFEVFVSEIGKHPVTQSGNEGIIVRRYSCMLWRRGFIYEMRYGDNLAFISWHALGRMRERCDVDIFSAGGIVALCGVAGLLMRDSFKHHGTAINLAFKDLICAGTLRYVLSDEPGRWHGFFDVLTALEPNILNNKRAAQMKQGTRLTNAVLDYINSDNSRIAGWAEKIPVLPFDESDYVSRELGERERR
jgi:hypothetical protein